MKKGKKSDYDLNMNDYSQMYDYNLITLRLITQLCLGYLVYLVLLSILSIDMSAGEMFCWDINIILSILSIIILSVLSNTKYPKVIVNPCKFKKNSSR